jgi:uncharacterized GH25 family protein
VLLLVITVAALAADTTTSPALTHVLGTVLDASGKPAKGALVGVIESRQALLEMDRSGKTFDAKVGADGRFDLPLPRNLGTVTLVARSPGYLAVTSKPIALSAARLEVAPLKLQEGLKLTGRVVDEQRQPISGAVVQATFTYRGDTLRLGPVTSRGKTNREGSFEIAGLDSGIFKVTAFSSTHALWTKFPHRIDLTSASRRLDITLRRGEFLSGTVTEVTGQPITGVVVADSREDSTITTTSDARGRFRLGPFTEGQQRTISARLAGYSPLNEDLAPPRSDLVLVLNRNATLRGRVLDAETNRPVPGFRVTIHDPKRTGRDDWIGPRAFNAADGVFELSSVHAGAWSITVLAPGYVPWDTVDFAFQGGVTHQLAVPLTKGTVLRGRVTDKATGKALPGARVNYVRGVSHHYSEPANGTGPSPTLSDAAGAFVLEGVPPSGTVTLRARIDGYRPVAERVSVEAQDFVELTALRGAVIRVRVVAADGVMPLQSMVRLAQKMGSVSRRTDPQGRIEFAQEDPGAYQLEASTDTGRSESKELILEEGQVLDLMLRVTPAAIVRGRLSGIPAGELETIKVGTTGFYVPYFTGPNDLSDMMRDEANRTGTTYIMQGLAGGAAVIGAGSPTRFVLKEVKVPERGEVTLDFDFANVQISGRVTRNGRPVPGVRVYASPRASREITAFASTGASGEYELCDLPPGEYMVVADDASRVIVEVRNPVVQDFELAQSGIAGRVVDASTGRGLIEVTPYLQPLGKRPTGPYFFGIAPPSNVRGEFSFPQLEPGEYQLVLHRGGYDLAEQRVVIEDSLKELVITMQPTEGVRLRVRSSQPDGGSAIAVSVASSNASSFSLTLPLDSDGIARLPPALAGRTFRILYGSYEPVMIERWNGAPLDIELRATTRR